MTLLFVRKIQSPTVLAHKDAVVVGVREVDTDVTEDVTDTPCHVLDSDGVREDVGDVVIDAFGVLDPRDAEEDSVGDAEAE